MGSFLSTTWTELLGTSDHEYVSDIEIDSDNYIYICGTTSGNLDNEINNGNDDGFISKLDTNGNKIWIQ